MNKTFRREARDDLRGQLGCLRIVTAKSDTPSNWRLRKFGAGLFLVWGLVSLGAAYYVGLYLYLVHLYGLVRVRTEHLRFTATPKGQAWIVSNGDHITGGHFLHYLISMGLWLVLFAVTFALLYQLLPKKYPASQPRRRQESPPRKRNPF